MDEEEALRSAALAEIARRIEALRSALQECRDLMHADNPADGWADAIAAADAALAATAPEQGEDHAPKGRRG